MEDQDRIAPGETGETNRDDNLGKALTTRRRRWDFIVKGEKLEAFNHDKFPTVIRPLAAALDISQVVTWNYGFRWPALMSIKFRDMIQRRLLGKGVEQSGSQSIGDKPRGK